MSHDFINLHDIKGWLRYLYVDRKSKQIRLKEYMNKHNAEQQWADPGTKDVG